MSDQDVTTEISAKNGLKKSGSKVRLDLEQRKILVSASLISVLVAVMVANQTLLKKEDSNGQARTIANVSRFMKLDNAQLEWQKKLAQELAEHKGKRDLASLGRPPNAFDQLRFGFFEGKYSFQLEHGKIKEINFVDSGESKDRPKYVEDQVKFLNEHRDLFSLDFSNIEMGSVEHRAGFKTQSYTLYKNSKIVGWAKFYLDEERRTHALKFEENKE